MGRLRVGRRLRIGMVGLVGAAVALSGAPLLYGENRASAVDPPSAERAPSAWNAGKSATAGKSVTLITGDRVDVRGSDGRKVAIRPGKGRRHIRFTTTREDDHLYVVPSDAIWLVRTGRLDKRVFDVLGLIRQGYDDSRSSSVPLLVQYAKGSRSARALDASGVSASRSLPVIGGVSVRVSKADVHKDTTTWKSLQAAEGVRRYWLNGKRKPNLAQSVPQIGAPEVWKSGFTGKGVRIAVLDTGIDKTHPDLAGRVVAEKDFTGSGRKDTVGHGTHVASTAAGNGKASKGRYKGVAPDASLLNAKVCGEEGCTDEAILAGMQWAVVDQKAKVANLSFGGRDLPEVDPVEKAVGDLTKKTGILFVVSAGNEGPGAGTVGSPGSAESALTVGAVDKKDQIAEFSSRGPRVGDGGIKPDVTAPGVDIGAAKSKDSEGSEPVPGRPQYVIGSGTSMSAPHAAGAAALLAQQHKAWKAPDLKGALMNAAKPHKDLSVFEQGAGRIEAAAASQLTVFGIPGSLSFGTPRWPHHDDRPVKRTLTFRNAGARDITLSLSASMRDPEGAPAPDGAVGLSATSLAVPAGKTAIVTVTANTRHDGPDGQYTGAVVAKAGGSMVTTPIQVDKEVESYNLTIDHVDGKGKPVEMYEDHVRGTDVDAGGDPCCGSTVKLRLPKGTYLVDSLLYLGETSTASTVWSALKLDRDRTVTSDARKTEPLRFTVPDPSARLYFGEVAYERKRILGPGREGSFGRSIMFDSRSTFTTRGVGWAEPDAMYGNVQAQFGLPGQQGEFVNSPYIYALSWPTRSRTPTGFDKAVEKRDLAKVASEQGTAMRKGRDGSRYINGSDVFSMSMGWIHELPSKVDQFHTTDGVRWFTDVSESSDADSAGLEGPSRSYRAGRTYKEKFGRGVFGPWFPDRGYPWSARNRSMIEGLLPLFSDQYGNAGWDASVDKGNIRLLRDGKVLYQGWPEGNYLEVGGLPAERGTFRLEATAMRSKGYTVSTKVDHVWTFRSSETSRERALPLWGVRFSPNVDPRSVLHDGPEHSVPLHVKAQPGSDAGVVKKVGVKVSADDGKTWKKAGLKQTGHGRYKLKVDVPKGTKFVSLRTTLTDSKGNSTEQTILRAYALA